MFKENTKLEKILAFGRRIIPRKVFRLAQPIYHWVLSILGAARHGFPSRSLRVIGITGTKGKSTTVYMLTKIFEDAGESVAAIGSLGIKIKDKEWPNTLKMTMPGRMRLQQFIAQAKRARCEYLILEVTSEGLTQMRHIGIKFDCAVFTNLHEEHIESHGSFEKYRMAKEKLFRITRNIHVLNSEDPHLAFFSKYPARKKLFFGLQNGDINQSQIQLKLKLAGEFNIRNALTALAVAYAYGLDLSRAQTCLEKIEQVSGRMEFIQREPFAVIVDYAHTPESLEAVYKTVKDSVITSSRGRLIGVLGATGGGRDKWKRPVYGKLASKYCDEIILTDEDPYDEDPQKIIDEIKLGLLDGVHVREIIDRREAIRMAIQMAKLGDVVVITGKGSEIIMAIAKGQKIPWSDKEIALEALQALNAS